MWTEGICNLTIPYETLVGEIFVASVSLEFTFDLMLVQFSNISLIDYYFRQKFLYINSCNKLDV